MTPLDKVGIRRILFVTQKKMMQIWRQDYLGVEWMQEEAEKYLFWLNECRGIYNYEVAVGEHSWIVSIQPTAYSEWINIEMEKRQACNMLE